ncbi:orotidine-5'-phosphate decarboxylase [Thermoactinomyces intermedius]|uniref:Orotidine 5'-phosphate decarboxylase n=1 Tax=Thermoactinomyces intermedius TaxID=2024 RepID=A0A8I1DEY4_THEIN|nr:orotidine-5'-phosphate decarboxylase [Thermoactinomyces intermedius]MBA4547529.1 orotidine-5'-phosphate decarboxylase [Thermoactinomyces intermedius]MBA4837769.1 orotidine-5'-phosphate decarboxylase [Thermoactinomyces intermedius]MBH8594241.1 orotidine-5'-phosphate decarboxylase [Thermoactinomyces intermedius]
MENPQNRIFLALDVPDEKQADHLLSLWDPGERPLIKVGYQLFFAAGPQWVEKRKNAGDTIFLDLKLHDIPNTVAKGIESLSRLGVDFVTIHASGGRKMMEKARETADKHADGSRRLKLLAVTQLTSTDQKMLNQELGIPGDVRESVQKLASLACGAGMDGVICSGLEARWVKQVTGTGFLAVTPGIRPQGFSSDDQKRIVTPREAVLNGADYLVVGRPVTQAPDPKKAFQSLVEEIR